jgi:hypothetical protein
VGSFRAFVYRTLSRVGVLATDGYPMAPHGHDFTANLLHLDEDVVCPRCLGWIEPDDIVRRTAYGPAQHEHCPVRVAVPCR